MKSLLQFSTTLKDKLCTYIDRNGVWHSEDCSTRLPGLCKATTKGVYDDHTSDRGDYNDCPDGWFNSVDDVTGHYCIRAFSELETQNGAETACNNQHGGSLVSIHGPEKNQRVGQGGLLKLFSSIKNLFIF